MKQHPATLPVWSLSLGCPKNRVDTEHTLGSLGLPVRGVAHPGHARLVFINTCGFIEPAVRESVRNVLEMIERLRSLKRRPLLAVGGCMVGRYGAEEQGSAISACELELRREAERASEEARVMGRLRAGLAAGAGLILAIVLY